MLSVFKQYLLHWPPESICIFILYTYTTQKFIYNPNSREEHTGLGKWGIASTRHRLFLWGWLRGYKHSELYPEHCVCHDCLVAFFMYEIEMIILLKLPRKNSNVLPSVWLKVLPTHQEITQGQQKLSIMQNWDSMEGWPWGMLPNCAIRWHEPGNGTLLGNDQCQGQLLMPYSP